MVIKFACPFTVFYFSPSRPAGEHSLALAPLQQLAAGVYLLQVRAGSQLTSQRVVVQ